LTHIEHSEKVLVMKVFLTVLILVFNLQSWSKANDVKDFEIEGITVGESLLDYYSEKEIKKKINEETSIWYPKNAYVSILVKSKNFKTYEELGIVLDATNNKYIIEGIEGTFNYKDDIDECYKKQDIITSDLKDMFLNNVEFQSFKSKYQADKSGKSLVKYNDFYFKNGGAIRVICYDMNKDFMDPNDQLYLAINSKKFLDWLNENM